MAAGDIAAVAAIAARVHPDFPESPAVFAERQRLAPAGCLMLQTGDAAEGYVLSHPWTLASPPVLDTLLGALPAAPDCWYLHDLALLPSTRGAGLGPVAVDLLAARARAAGLPRMALVAVNGSAPFWLRQGFDPAPPPAKGLAGYGADAVFMTRGLAA